MTLFLVKYLALGTCAPTIGKALGNSAIRTIDGFEGVEKDVLRCGWEVLKVGTFPPVMELNVEKK